MHSQFQIYVANLNRVNFVELVDFYANQRRLANARPSLVTHPLTGEFYATRPQMAQSAPNN
jgi:hypothetical protein